jgi:ATP-dependent DNA helicase RecQ
MWMYELQAVSKLLTARETVAIATARPFMMNNFCLSPILILISSGLAVEGKLSIHLDKIQQFNHHTISTFGIGKAFPASQWSSIFRQLVAAGFLAADTQAYGGLKLSDAARPVLKGEKSVWLRQDIAPETLKRNTLSKAERISRSKEAFEGANDDPLWLAFKAERLRLALEQGVPPYLIFHDSTLLEIMHQKPQSLDNFANISGVGQAKLMKYADAFLAVLEEMA